MRADFRVGDTIYEIKWGANGSTFSINKCVDKHLNAINNLKEKFQYKVLTCVQNTHTKARPMTPFLEEIQKELAGDLNAIELFTQLTQALQNIATAKNTELLKHYQNAFYSIFEQTLKKQKQEIKEYIKEIIESLAICSIECLQDSTELLEFLIDNNLQKVPDTFLGNAMIEGELRQVHVMLPDYLAENADLDEDEDLTENTDLADNAAPAPAPAINPSPSSEPTPHSEPAPKPTPVIKPESAVKPDPNPATSDATPVGQQEAPAEEASAKEQAGPQDEPNKNTDQPVAADEGGEAAGEPDQPVRPEDPSPSSEPTPHSEPTPEINGHEVAIPDQSDISLEHRIALYGMKSLVFLVKDGMKSLVFLVKDFFKSIW